MLILGVLLLRRAFGNRLSPGWRIALWVVVIAKLVLPVSVSFVPGLGSFWRTESQAATVATGEPVQMAEMPAVTEMVSSPAVSVVSWSVHEMLMLIWLAGALAVLTVALLRDAAFKRKLHAMQSSDEPALIRIVREITVELGLRRTPQIRIAEADTVPAVTGLLHPTVILPRNWREALQGDSLTQVLRHELAHLKHHDLWWNWAVLLVNAVHWFNPLVWRAVAEFHEDRELRCDASALAACSPQQRVGYGRALLYFQEHFSAPAATAGLAPFVRNQPALHQRLLMITQPSVARPWLHALAALSLGLFVCAAFGAERPEDDKSTTRTREGERSGGTRETGKREGGEREGGDMGRAKGGEREGGKPAEGMRDGDRPREGAKRDGDREGGERGVKDGERSRTGPRDGERSREGGEKDGERTKATSEGAGSLVLRVIDGGENVMVGKEKVPLNRLRHHLSQTLPNHAGAQVTIEADDDVPFKTVGQVLDAARDNGAKRAQIQSASSTKGEG